MIRVLFVCLGNICRSPMAEGGFLHLVTQVGLENKIVVDSAGTSSYHMGERPDERMSQTAEKHGVTLNHRARQLQKEDFNTFDYIIAMDSKNFHNIKLLAETVSAPKAYKVHMMREFDLIPGSGDVPDPYFGGMDGFEEVYEIVMRSSKNLLDHIIKEHRLQ